MTTLDAAMQTARQLGSIAAREGRPRCLDNGGQYQDKDYATLHALGGGVARNNIQIGNAWFEGYDAGLRGPQGELAL